MLMPAASISIQNAQSAEKVTDEDWLKPNALIKQQTSHMAQQHPVFSCAGAVKCVKVSFKSVHSGKCWVISTDQQPSQILIDTVHSGPFVVLDSKNNT